MLCVAFYYCYSESFLQCVIMLNVVVLRVMVPLFITSPQTCFKITIKQSCTTVDQLFKKRLAALVKSWNVNKR